MFHIEEFDTIEEANERMELVKKMKSSWKVVKISDKPKPHDGKYFFMWTDKL